MKLSAEQKKAHLAAGLNEDGTVKEVKKSDSVDNLTTGKVKYVPSDLVVKEMMLQKNISREEAFERLTKTRLFL
jgi:hypothetical protein